MKHERAFPLQILAALLVYSSLAWSQGFGTNVVGFATACQDTNKYSQSGPLEFDSSGQELAQCNPSTNGGASARSQADLHFESAGFVVSDDAGSARAAALTYDTVTLKPPQGFNGNSVTFIVMDSYAMGIRGTGSVKTCWTAPRLLNNCVNLTHGTGSGTLKAPVTLTKSKSGFQFEITKSMAASIAGDGGNASFATGGEPSFNLPKGWKCSFASGASGLECF